MFCESPKNGFPCNHCRACRLRQANEKMIISVFAAHEYKTKGQFLTLTYDDEHRPDGLQVAHFQSFMKKLRELDKTPGVKMFYAGEYGGDENGTHREHWHVLFYNHRYDIDLVQKAWSEPRKRGRKKKGEVDPYKPFGFVYDGTLTPQSMKYVSGYVDKKGYDPKSGKRPPFGRSSVNLPDGLSNREIQRAMLTGRIKYNGRLFSFPRKWRKKYRRLWELYAPRRHLLQYNMLQDKKELSVEQIKAIMDEKERKYNIKKEQKKKKRLQKLLQRRIM